MEGFQAWDRHKPLPHIALSTTALKSAYSNTALPSTRIAAELRELLIPGGRERWAPGLVFFVCGRGGIARSVLSRRGSCIPGRLIAGLHASPPGKHLMDSDLMPCQRVLVPVTSAGPATGPLRPPHRSLPAGAGVGEVPVTT
jgi:hypothetical protein